MIICRLWKTNRTAAVVMVASEKNRNLPTVNQISRSTSLARRSDS